MKIYRHGDILIKEVDPKNNLKQMYKGQKYIVARGEATGHHHLLTAKPQTDFQILQDNQGNLYLRGAGVLTHEEHKPITIKKGFYFIGREQEYDYFALYARRVID